MGKHITTTIRYDGPALTEHEMDVQALAPALLALAEMIQLANKKFNGDAATMKVLVKADIEQQCFQLDIHIVQSILETAKHLFGTDEYKTAKEIAELLDLVLPTGFAGGVWWFWRKFYGQETPPSGTDTAIQFEQHGGQTILATSSEGGQVTVNNNVFLLATDPEMVALAQKVLKPLKLDGYKTLGFYRDNKPTVEWDKEEAKRFLATPANDIGPQQEDETVNRTPIRTIVSVKTQRNEGKARWEIKWASKAEWASMDDLEWLERFQAGRIEFSIPYWLDVTLEMVTSRVDPDAPPSFAIKKVHDLINHPEGKQGNWLDDDA